MTTETVKQRAIIPDVQILQREAPDFTQTIRLKRVAAYCRVSTDMEQQASSLDTQMRSFRELIVSRPGWELAGIYADEGLSGTRAANRREFQRMIADCEAGAIDYIVTKSISRFARNTMDCLAYVRRLKDMGIYVYFDEHHLDTGNTSSEMLLSILAAVAQEESHNISENIKWGMRKRFQAGKPKWTLTYGFTKGGDGEYHINEEQAEGVRRIFELYVSGASLPEIARTLDKEGIPPMKGGKWWPKTLATVLRNEKYIGDVMMQKYYTIDHISHKKVKNDQTVVPSYYVKNHHEAIVDRKTFDVAQTILSIKDSHQGCPQYPYHEFLVCPICGGKLVRFHLPIRGHSSVWMCANVNEGIKCPPYVIFEKYVDRIVRDAYEALDEGELRALSAKPGAKGQAAKACLEWRKKHPRLERIEYAFLDALIERITFSKWREAVVSWKFGRKSRVSVEYAKPSEIPNVELIHTDGGFTVNGESIRFGSQVQKRVNRTIACCERVRLKNCHGRSDGVRKTRRQ